LEKRAGFYWKNARAFIGKTRGLLLEKRAGFYWQTRAIPAYS